MLMVSKSTEAEMDQINCTRTTSETKLAFRLRVFVDN